MMEPSRTNGRIPLLKVTAAVIEKDGRVLVARRRRCGENGGLWEFPGGKLEADEPPEKGLRREIGEEFGVSADIGEFLGSYRSGKPGPLLELLVFRVRLTHGELRPVDHEEVRWITPEEMDESLFTEPDRRVIRRLKADRASR